jgi:hypothetical protein
MIRLLVARLKCNRKNKPLFILIRRHVDFREYTYIYFTKKDVTRVLSVVRWDVSCSEVSDTIQSQVFPCMNHFTVRVLIKYGETRGTEYVDIINMQANQYVDKSMCRQINV